MSFKVLLQNTFGISTFVMFFIAAIILIFIDSKHFKKKGFNRESKLCKFFGLFFIICSFGMYIVMKFIVI